MYLYKCFGTRFDTNTCACMHALSTDSCACILEHLIYSSHQTFAPSIRSCQLSLAWGLHDAQESHQGVWKWALLRVGSEVVRSVGRCSYLRVGAGGVGAKGCFE